MRITRSPKGAGKRKVELSQVQIPDLWHLAMWLNDADGDRTVKKLQPNPVWPGMVLECWHLCHDLVANLADPSLITYFTEGGEVDGTNDSPIR